MAITIDEYIQTRSTFDPTTPDNVKLIAQATLQIGPHCNDDLTNLAIALLVMHWLTIAANGSQGSGGTGAPQELEEGDLRISFASISNMSNIDPFLAMSSYGIELFYLGKKCLLTPMNRMMTL